MSTIAQDAIALKQKVEAGFATSPSAEGNQAIALLAQLVHLTQYIVEDEEPAVDENEAEAEASRLQAEEDAKASAAQAEQEAAAQAQAEAEANSSQQH